MRKSVRAGLAFLLSLCLVVGYVPAAAFAGDVAGGMVSDQVDTAKKNADGTYTMGTLVKGISSDALADRFDFVRPIDRGPFTKSDIVNPDRCKIVVKTVNGTGAPEDYQVTWSRYVVNGEGVESPDPDPSFTGNDSAGNPLTTVSREEASGVIVITYDLSRDVFSDEVECYHYYVAVTDASNPRETITTRGGAGDSSQAITVMPRGESLWGGAIDDGVRTASGGGWTWQLNGADVDDERAAQKADGQLDKFARLNSEPVDASQPVHNVLAQAAASGVGGASGPDAAGGRVVEGMWLVGISNDVNDGPQFVNTVRMTLDVTDYVGGPSATPEERAQAAAKLGLLQSLDGKAVASIPLAEYVGPNDSKPTFVERDGRVLVSFLIDSKDVALHSDARSFGYIALTAPKPQSAKMVKITGAVAVSDGAGGIVSGEVPDGCSIDPAGEQTRSTSDSIPYTFKSVAGWAFEQVFVDGRAVVAGEADGDGNTAYIDMSAGGGSGAGSGAGSGSGSGAGAQAALKPVGVWATNGLTLNLALLDAAYAAAGKALVDGQAISVVAAFSEDEEPPIPERSPKLKIPVMDNGVVEVTYTDVDGAIQSATTANGALELAVKPGTDVQMAFRPTPATGQWVVGYIKDDGTKVRDKVLVGGVPTTLVANACTIERFGLDDSGSVIEGDVSVEAAFFEGQERPDDDTYTFAAVVAPDASGVKRGVVHFGYEGGDASKPITTLSVKAGTDVTFNIVPAAEPAPGYVFDKAILVQEGVDYGQSAGEDVSRYISDDGVSLTIPAYTGAPGKGTNVTVTFHFKKDDVRLTVPESIGAGADGKRTGTVSPTGVTVIPEGGAVDVTIKPASGFELNPDAQLVLSGKPGTSPVVVPVSQLDRTYDDSGNPVYMLPVKYVDVVRGLGGQATLGVQGGDLFKKIASEPEKTYYKVTTKKNMQTVGGATASGSLSVEGTAKVEAGETFRLCVMPGEGSKLVSIRVSDAPGGKQRVRTFDGFAVGPLTDWPLANIVSDTSIEVTFAPVGNGEQQGGLDEDLIDVIKVCAAGEIVGKGSVSPDPGSTVTLPRGGSQKFVFAPADGWKVGRITLGGVEGGAGSGAGAKVLAEGVNEYVYKATGGVKGTLYVEFVEAGGSGDEPVDPDDPTGGQVEVDIRDTVDAKVQLVDVSLDVNSAVEASFDEYIGVDMPVQHVKRGESVSFTLTLKDKRWTDGGKWGYYGLYDVSTTPSVSGIQVVPLVDDGAQSHVSATYALTRDGVSRLGLPYRAAGVYSVTIPNVQSDLKVAIQLAKLSSDTSDPAYSDAAQVAPSDRNVPDSFTLYAASDGGGWVLPLLTSSNGGTAEAQRPGMTVHDVAADEAARYVEFVPFKGYYLKSAYVQLGSYGSGGAWKAASGNAGKAVNVFSRIVGSRLDVREVFDALDVPDGGQVRLLATFALIGAQSEEITVTWGGGFAAGPDGPSDTPVACTVTPELSTGASGTKFAINAEQTFTFTPSGTSAQAPNGWALDYLLVNGERVYPLPGMTYVTLPMDTDMDLVAVFRPLEDGEQPPKPPLSYDMTLTQPAEGGSVTVGGSTGPIPVVAGQSQTAQLVPSGPTRDYEWILDAVTLDGVQLIPWKEGQALPDGFAFDPTTGEGTTAAGEHFKLDYAAGTLTIDGVMAAHGVGAAFARAVDLRVTCDTDSGLITPRGEFKWRVSVERDSSGKVKTDAQGREILKPDELSVYVAPYDENELERFDVNGSDAKDELVTPLEAEGGLQKLKGEHKALASGSHGSSSGLGSGANWVTMAAAESSADPGTSLLETLGLMGAKSQTPTFGPVQAYRLSADDLTRDGSRVTTINASFEEPQGARYTVKATVAGGVGHGKINGQDSVEIEVEAGRSASLTFTCDAGYVVRQVRDNKVVRTDFTNAGYTIKDVQADHEVEVYFGVPGTPGSNDAATRAVRQVQSMLKTGDAALPLVFISLGIALAAAGVAVFVSSKRRKL